MTPSQQADARRLHAEGLWMREVGRRIGVPESTLRRFARREGLWLKPDPAATMLRWRALYPDKARRCDEAGRRYHAAALARLTGVGA